MSSKTWIVAMGLVLAIPAAHAETLKVSKLEFVAETNVKMFRYKGQTTAVKTRIERKGSELTALEVSFPVESLKTGMEVRDKHTHERIFTAENGTTPDVVFSASKSDCKPAGADFQCTLDGKLAFRGKEKPLRLTATLKGNGTVEGQTVIDVLDFGVDPKVLAWTTVKVDPKVPVTFEGKIE